MPLIAPRSAPGRLRAGAHRHRRHREDDRVQLAPGRRLRFSTDPAQRRSTIVYDGDGRPSDTYGPAPVSCFGADSVVPNGNCAATTVGHTATVYDGGIVGLAAHYWSSANLAGPPNVYEPASATRPGRWWPTGPSAPPNASLGSDWSARFTGKIALDQPSNPVEGGSCNDYDYVCGDPVNGLDLDGRADWSKGDWRTYKDFSVLGAGQDIPLRYGQGKGGNPKWGYTHIVEKHGYEPWNIQRALDSGKVSPNFRNEKGVYAFDFWETRKKRCWCGVTYTQKRRYRVIVDFNSYSPHANRGMAGVRTAYWSGWQ